MFRGDSPGYSEAARVAIAKFAQHFEPEWEPDRARFSKPHYLVLSRADNPAAYHYDKPVRVLMDGGCFSATDIFLAALETRDQVRLVGTPSGGDSGRARGYRLTNSGIRLQLSSMVSYQPDGTLLEGNGVEPHILAEPIAPDLVVGGTDTVLDRALASLGQ